jgi:hypothetical protein
LALHKARIRRDDIFIRAVMDENPKPSWYELCELAAKEENPEKLLRLVQEINRLLEKKDHRPQSDDKPPKAA